jgi:hypothetical protein
MSNRPATKDETIEHLVNEVARLSKLAQEQSYRLEQIENADGGEALHNLCLYSSIQDKDDKWKNTIKHALLKSQQQAEEHEELKGKVKTLVTTKNYLLFHDTLDELKQKFKEATNANK